MTLSLQHSELFNQFEALEIDTTAFGHREHLQVAFEMLHKYDYLDACSHYANNINKLAKAAGAPKKFNVTITFAFLSLIAKRMVQSEGLDFERFIDANSDLLDSSVLHKWYSAEELESEFARTHFLLPSS